MGICSSAPPANAANPSGHVPRWPGDDGVILKGAWRGRYSTEYR
jgi:hypothetical protein